MKPLVITVAALSLQLALLLAVAQPGAAETIKLGTLAPKGSPWHKAIQDIAEAWKKDSNGSIRVRIYAGGVSGDEPDMTRKMRIGQLHAASMTGAGLMSISQEIQALQMPMMFRSDQELDYVRERMAPRLEGALAAKGFIVLNWVDAGWVYFFTKKPVVTLDDLKPLKLFAWVGETAHIGGWRDAGFHPIPLPATEIHTALQSGLIQALPTTPIAALSFQWFGQAKHMTDVKWAPLVGATLITKRKWRRIPKALRTAMMKTARVVGNRLQASIRSLGAKAVEVMKKHGLQVHPVPPSAVSAWEKGASKAYGSIIGKIVPADVVAEVERLRDEYRAKQKGR
ncbi:MAG: TRAP transporter substrate-binding protein DctP [Alphaproteobacteria bacterium]